MWLLYKYISSLIYILVIIKLIRQNMNTKPINDLIEISDKNFGVFARKDIHINKIVYKKQ